MIFTHLRKAYFAAKKMAPFIKFSDEVYGHGSEKRAKWCDFYSTEKLRFSSIMCHITLMR